MAFTLSDEFINTYEGIKPDWGFKSGPNSVGELTYFRTYSRKKEDGTNEDWHETVRRVVEGAYELQYRHAEANDVAWDDAKAHRSAEEMYDRIFNFKFTPPGRGIWVMGTDYVLKRGSAALQNCGFVSTLDEESPSRPYTWAMDMLMLGVGVGSDTKGESQYVVGPTQEEYVFAVPDSREGWVDALRRILDSYFIGGPRINFDYQMVRPYGAPIKGFGGTASGPKPLEEMLEKIRGILDSRRGGCVGVRAVADIMNLIGCCVVAGNVRRSAELIIGPSSDEFLELKDYNKNPDRATYGWASNNSVVIYDDEELKSIDFDAIAERVANNGEPGMVFVNNTRKFARMGEHDESDYLAVGYNPCVSTDTWVTTEEGPRQVGDLIDKPSRLLLDGKFYDATGFWKTGTKPLFKVKMDSGHQIRVTDNHKIMTVDGWKEAGELSVDDEVVLSDNYGVSWNGEGTQDEGYLLGMLVGDGTFKKHQNGSDVAVISVWENERDLMEKIESIAFEMPHRSDFKGFNGPHGETKWYGLALASITALAQDYDIVIGNKTITKKIEESSSEMHIGFLRGLFDADGSPQGTRKKGLSVRLAQSDLGILHAAQRMLSRLGIHSKVYESRKDAGYYELPDGKGGSAPYYCESVHELIVSRDQIARFAEIVGFESLSKSARLEDMLKGKRALYSTKFQSKIVSIEQDGVEDVYDVTVDEVHAFDANGIYVHNCAEQPLHNYELCCLVESFPARHDSLEDYLRTLKFAYLYAKTVTLVDTHDEGTNEVMRRNRRIGTSMSGIVQFLDTHDEDTLKRWTNTSYHYVQDLDAQYSNWLNVPRSIRTTTVKPSGTVSLLSGATPGIHYPVADYYIRRVRLPSGSKILNIMKEAGYHVEADVFSANTFVVEMPVKGEGLKTESEVSIWDKYKVAEFMARNWADNAVSCTITFKEEEVGEIADVLRAASKNLKTISLLPISTDTYAQMPYEAISPERYDEMIRDLNPIDWSEFTGDGKMEKFCDTDVCEIDFSKL